MCLTRYIDQEKSENRMVDVLQDPSNTAKMHSDLLASYSVGEEAVLKQLEQINLIIRTTDSIELSYLLAKAYIFGNLVNIKWLYYHNRLNDLVAKNVEESNTPVFHQNYLYGVKLYSEIIKSFSETLDKESQFEQYIAYELYLILSMSDQLRHILSIPSHTTFSDAVQQQLSELKTLLVRILGQVGYPAILVDYNAYFLNKDTQGLSPQQILTVISNYETVVNEFSIPLHIQDQAREALFYIYLKGKYGIPQDQVKALSYLDNSTDNILLEAVGFDLYYGSNSLIHQDKAKAEQLFSRCYANSDKIKVWSKVNEPTWHAEFERRSKALENFFKSTNIDQEQ